jgi:hypothetical protein
VRRTHLLRALTAVAAVAALSALAACDDDHDTSAGTVASTSSAASAGTAAAEGVTMASYQSVTAGMTVAQVAAITGSCPQTNSATAQGHDVVAYDCTGAQPFTGASFIFSDGKLVSKSQYGLDGGTVDNSGHMTKAAYDQLQPGQTASEVTAITGPCTKSSETAIAGKQGYTLTCYASSGTGSAILLFVDDTLVSSSQNGLS